jgi:hypothetical protein
VVNASEMAQITAAIALNFICEASQNFVDESAIVVG